MIRPAISEDRNNDRPADSGQLLNPIDRTMQYADRAIRQMGYPGIETQMLVWLAGRTDVTALRAAIARLSQRYPVVAARLIEPSDDGRNRPHWQYRRGEQCLLREQTLSSDERNAVLDHAGETLSAGRDPAEADPIEFHLLHLPGGKDVFLLQYNHVLMDNRAAEPLLLEIDRLAAQDNIPSVATAGPPNHLIEHLRQYPRQQRHQAIRAAIELQAHALRGRAATLLPVAEAPPGRARLRIATRILGSAETTDFRDSVVARCGYPCLSMALLGTAFRAIQYLGPATGLRRNFAAAIGIPLRRNQAETLAFENLTSVVPICVEPAELQDRNRLPRLLSQQLRHRLTTGIDLGVLGATTVFGRRFRYIEWVIWHVLRYGYSLWYGYFAAPKSARGQLCGADIEDLIYTGGPVWPWTGLALLVNQYGGRLHFQATYDPRLVPPLRAETLLDFVLEDLPATRPAVR